MELSVFMARLIAILYVAVGIGALIDGTLFKKIVDDFSKNTGLVYIGGLLALLAGLALVTYHNIWGNSWKTLITVFGWLTLIKGVMFITFPKASMKLSKSMNNVLGSRCWGTVCLILGLVIGYFGFMV